MALQQETLWNQRTLYGVPVDIYSASAFYSSDQVPFNVLFKLLSTLFLIQSKTVLSLCVFSKTCELLGRKDNLQVHRQSELKLPITVQGILQFHSVGSGIQMQDVVQSVGMPIPDKICPPEESSSCKWQKMAKI